MKRNLFSQVLAVVLLITTPLLTSCKDDDKDDPKDEFKGDELIEKIDDINGDELHSVKAQKNYLGQVGEVAVEEFETSNVSDILRLLNYCVDKFDSENWSWDEVDEWGEKCLDDLISTELGTSKSKKEYSNSYVANGYYDNETGKYVDGEITYNFNYIVNYNTTSVETLYKASNFTGHFTAKNKKWNYEPADDLQFIFTDQDGKECVLRLSTSGKVVNLHVADDTDEECDYDSSKYSAGLNADRTEYNEIYDYFYDVEKTRIVVAIPENITLSFSQDGKTLIEQTVTTNLNVVNAPDYNFAKDKYAVKTVTKIGVYTFELKNASFSSGDKNAEASYTVKRGDTLLFKASVKAAGEMLDSEDDDVEFDHVDAVELSLDILGKVQIKGYCKNYTELDRLLDNACENEDNAAKYKEYISQANEYLDLAMYFNNGSEKQAKVILEPYVYESWGGKEYWDYDFMILFNDKTSYSFERYFNDSDFADLIDAFEALLNDYENKIDF